MPDCEPYFHCCGDVFYPVDYDGVKAILPIRTCLRPPVFDAHPAIEQGAEVDAFVNGMRVACCVPHLGANIAKMQELAAKSGLTLNRFWVRQRGGW